MATGVIHPFRRTERDFASATGDAETLAQVSLVLGTAKGSLPWRPDFGSDLTRLRHKGNNPVLRETARVFIDDALRKWVPAAKLVSVDVERILKTTQNLIDIHVVVQIGNKQQALTQRI